MQLRARQATPTAHVILRGGKVPNYNASSVDAASSAITAAGLTPCMMIDASHGNSGKRHENQPAVVDAIAGQIEAGDPRIGGVMVESHLVAGRQDWVAGKPLRYGQSITDGCIGWETSVRLLERLAAAVERRARTSLSALGRSSPSGRSTMCAQSSN